MPGGLNVKKRGNILDLIGNTPLVEIKRLKPKGRVRIMAKIESFNPGGSIKDRVALAIIEHAEQSGELTPGKTIIEATSGNTGIGLAMVAAVKGYPLLLTMAESVSEERRKILKAYGAELLLTPSHLGTDGAIEEAYRLAREQPDKYFLADQFNNQMSVMAHYRGTGVEVWRQTRGKVTAFVATMGTSGTLMGVSRRLREYNPAVRIVGVEPYMGHKIQGLKNMKESYKPGIFDRSALDEIVNVDDDSAFEMARRLAKEEGMLVGMSSGAAMHVAYEQARKMKEGLLVVVFPDGGERYLSTVLFQGRKTSHIKFFNTLTRRKEDFIPLEEGKVGMYSCGPTVHQLIHLDICRRIVFADLIRRYLEFKGFKVTHVMNITDLDDKTIAGSQAKGIELEQFTDFYTEEFLKDVDLLRVKRADLYPRASRHIEDMVRMGELLQDKGYAYEKFRSLYFDISHFKQYGRLSRVDLSKIRLGKTVDLDEYEKDNPRDFTLLKRATLAELKRGIFFKTRWGNVRPGLHLECATMSTKYLGEKFDIHTGSTDHIFPHHENEIAIHEALTGKSPASYWMHSEVVTMDGKKMSRSPEKAVTLRDLLDKGYTGREVRYWLISTHYRKPLAFSYQALLSARRALRRLDEFINRLRFVQPGLNSQEISQALYDMKKGFGEAMDDDLNVSGALAAVFDFVRRINPLLIGGSVSQENKKDILDVFKSFDSILDIMELEENQEEMNEYLRGLIEKREEARREKRWQEADRIRQELWRSGIEIIDTLTGPRWRKFH
jgi:cysteinyl-tRNA synthetase